MKRGIKERIPDYQLKMIILSKLANYRKYIKPESLRKGLRQRWSKGYDMHYVTFDHLCHELKVQPAVWFSNDLNDFCNFLANLLRDDYSEDNILKEIESIKANFENKAESISPDNDSISNLQQYMNPLFKKTNFNNHDQKASGNYFIYYQNPNPDRFDSSENFYLPLIKTLLHIFPDETYNILRVNYTVRLKGKLSTYAGIVLPFSQQTAVAIEIATGHSSFLNLMLFEIPLICSTGIMIHPSFSLFNPSSLNFLATTRIFIERISKEQSIKGMDFLVSQTTECVEQNKLNKSIQQLMFSFQPEKLNLI